MSVKSTFDEKRIIEWLDENDLHFFINKLKSSILVQSAVKKILKIHAEIIDPKKKKGRSSQEVHLYLLMSQQISRFSLMMTKVENSILFFEKLNYLYEAEEAIDTMDEHMKEFKRCLCDNNL